MSIPEIQINEPEVVNLSSVSSGPIGKLVEALAKATLEFETVTKGSKNPFYNSFYADLEDVIKATRPALAKHGLVVIQMPSTEGKDVVLTTLLAHTSGEWIKSSCSCPCEKFDAQGIGKAISYLRRYSLQAFVNVAAEDDDGNEASGKSTATSKPKETSKKWEPPTERKTEKASYGSESEQPKANVHGLEITDEDLPDFLAPVEDPKPTPAQSKEIADRLRALKQDSRTLKSWVEKQAGCEWKAISQKKFQEILVRLEAASNVTELIGA